MEERVKVDTTRVTTVIPVAEPIGLKTADLKTMPTVIQIEATRGTGMTAHTTMDLPVIMEIMEADMGTVEE